MCVIPTFILGLFVGAYVGHMNMMRVVYVVTVNDVSGEYLQGKCGLEQIFHVPQ